MVQNPKVFVLLQAILRLQTVNLPTALQPLLPSQLHYLYQVACGNCALLENLQMSLTALFCWICSWRWDGTTSWHWTVRGASGPGAPTDMASVAAGSQLWPLLLLLLSATFVQAREQMSAVTLHIERMITQMSGCRQRWSISSRHLQLDLHHAHSLTVRTLRRNA